MLSLSKKTDYALIALAYLAERPGRTASAREIAEARSLPAALLMNILKELQHHDVVRSLRGTKGGYQLAVDPATVSLHELILALEGPVRLIECASEAEGCEHETLDEADDCRVSGRCAVQAPLQALHFRLVRFLHDVKLADIILPGRRIDVPVEMIGREGVGVSAECKVQNAE
ncbi:MAG TPA: Rrf2 family transcriptional regulator [Tepidisphaeraceae bacterium]|jgi:Rrf2 family protein|nr:Rrf2 family transcriptional regulator [Tepidisphaeraceae bacterium]